MRLLELMRLFRERPQMYFEGGSFSLAAAYIDGFANGAGEDVLIQLGQFRSWLADHAYQKAGTARNLSWELYVKNLCPDDCAAFNQLPELFEQFLQDKQ